MAVKKILESDRSLSPSIALVDTRKTNDFLGSAIGAQQRARLFFVFFLISGFCSLVYETIWLRLAMAAFGVTTASISIVVSVFMGGLALGSWTAGRLLRTTTWSPLWRWRSMTIPG